MKGIIVVEKPDACVDCRFCFEIDEGTEACCTLATHEIEQELYRAIDDYCQSVPLWCPIKVIDDEEELKKWKLERGLF